jgi:DNA polymerase-3 subunit gamma/tau
MHQALYRKWRPRTFDEVHGQDHITSILKYEAASSKFSHAYLFCGSRGTGKTTCAKILAKAVNCLDLKDGNPCGKCEACLAIDSGAATDVLEMDAASNNKVENIRDILEEVVYSPSNLKYRVYIIDEVHMLTTSAFNALLKTLEEPPEHVVFILATTELNKLPSTIVSRCQRFDFRRISTEVLKNHLMRIAEAEGIDIDEEAALVLAKHAQGGMRDAISLLDLCASGKRRIDLALVADNIGSSGRESMLEVVVAIAKKDYDTIFGAIDKVVQSSRDINVFWQELLAVYRDMMVMKSTRQAAAYLDLTDSETTALKTVADMFTLETLSYHCRMLQETYTYMARPHSVNRILAELTLVRMCDERLSESNDSILSRLSTLESAAMSGGFANQKQQTKQEIAEPKSENKNDTHKAAEKASARVTPKSYDDDDEFRGDAPTSSAQRVPIPEKKTDAGKDTGKRVLKPLRNRAEIVDVLDKRDRIVASSFKLAKWYNDESGKIVLKFPSVFDIDRAKQCGGEEVFLSVLSSVMGKPVLKNDVLYEVDGGTEANEKIDQIIDAIQGI